MRVSQMSHLTDSDRPILLRRRHVSSSVSVSCMRVWVVASLGAGGLVRDRRGGPPCHLQLTTPSARVLVTVLKVSDEFGVEAWPELQEPAVTLVAVAVGASSLVVPPLCDCDGQGQDFEASGRLVSVERVSVGRLFPSF